MAISGQVFGTEEGANATVTHDGRIVVLEIVVRFEAVAGVAAGHLERRHAGHTCRVAGPYIGRCFFYSLKYKKSMLIIQRLSWFDANVLRRLY